MSAQAASVGSLISTLLLSNYRVLNLSWKAPFSRLIEWSELRECIYLAFQPWAARYPDHVFSGSWDLLKHQNSGNGILLAAMQSLVDEFLIFSHDNLCIRRDLMGAWQQGVISRISSIPIQAAANVFCRSSNYFQSNLHDPGLTRTSPELTPWAHKLVPLLHSEEAIVADYVRREGLHEAHLHLNGSTFAETCWLRAIRAPSAEIYDFKHAWNKARGVHQLHELVGQVNPGLTPVLLFHHLRTAARLRAWLRGIAENRISGSVRLPRSLEELDEADEDEWSKGLIEASQEKHGESDIRSELSWMARLIGRLTQEPNVVYSRMFHAYVLLQNEYCQLLIQNEEQYGFDQFQKFTLTELREPAEKDYLERFRAMHGFQLSFSKVGYLEGRFAPKDTFKKSYCLFKSILSGYLEYLYEASSRPSSSVRRFALSRLLAELDEYFKQEFPDRRKVHRLTLVAHFIKKPWSPGKKSKTGLYRHYALGRELQKRANCLLSCLSQWPLLQTWVRGIDAAANELHAPPDIFAPVFRVCFRAGLTRRTYHAGEDFRHLLSGIATMWEALNLLDLENGDRIGHGTAMGISPALWIDRMPRTVTLSRGEWMLGILAAWRLARDIPTMENVTNRLQRDLEDIAYQIFLRSLPASAIARAMDLRGLSRDDVMLCQMGARDAQDDLMNERWQHERKRVWEACQRYPQDVALLWEWLSNSDVQKRSEDLIEVKTGYLDVSAYLRLQQALMRQVADRRVLIETLPSSNVRISQYHHVREHHALRWMRVPGYVEDGDPEIMVCLGSDDPGIFGTDLETEFYLLYGTMRESGLDDTESLHRLDVLNRRGRLYRFHHPLLA